MQRVREYRSHIDAESDFEPTLKVKFIPFQREKEMEAATQALEMP